MAPAGRRFSLLLTSVVTSSPNIAREIAHG
ncbi:hypothetical protein CCACVL1_08365 [Corchorus capsularis]|uniref:Uncharacterized protein n=1 Tax=Corchorus capsularis TaxID=210143 RepID=A0A1R3J0W7_COCAP|nr:hypothetical protein CCACVL1_08365 [Corchorus capsularis]